MKKLLIASTALVLSAGFASAQVTLGGSANMGVKYDGGAPVGTDKASLHYEIDFDIKGSGTTDGGLTFGASVDVDNTNGTAAAGTDGEVFISGAFGTLTVGGVDDANDGIGFADPGFDGIGVDDDAESGKGAGNSQDIAFSTTFDMVTLVVAASSTSDDVSVAVFYNGGNFNAGVGFADNDNGASAVALEIGGKFGDVSGNLFFADKTSAGGVNSTGVGVDVTYSMGATSIVLAAGDTDAAGDEADFGIGATYDLGGGAKLGGAIGSVDGETKADFGINFSF